MSQKKSDLMKGIEKFDAEIATLQQKIASLEEGKAILEGVLREKNEKSKKNVVEARKRAPRKPRTTAVAAAAETSEPMFAGA